MYEIRDRTKHSTPRIGQFFGGRDHTTVLNALRRVEEAFAAEAEARRALAQQEAA
jgi:chromosomal replication initiator protein